MILSVLSVRLNIVRFFHHRVWYRALGTLSMTLFVGRAKEENLTSNNYWSSTTNANNTDNAWIVNFNNGNTNNNNKSNTNNVRCVR
jgi:uncharacterized protein (TIGR02145 family)